jgi:Protein of unknown function (DUF1580)
VAIDPFSEQVLPFAQVARRLPSIRGGRAVNPATIWRWAAHGVRGTKLETVKIGGTTCTSLEALRRFFARLDDKSDSFVPTPTRDVRAEQVSAELEAIGI